MKKIIIQYLRIALILFTIQLIVGLIFLYHNLSIQTVLSAAIFSSITTLVIIVLLAAYQLIFIKVNKISFKDFGVNSTQESSFVVDKSMDEIKNVIDTIIPDKINSYKFSYDKDKDVYKTKTGASINSWGEIVIIKLSRIDEFKTQLFVLSKSVYKMNLIDFGKSSMNIKKIKLAFS